MAKSRRNKQKRKQRKTRKQRGGSSMLTFIKGIHPIQSDVIIRTDTNTDTDTIQTIFDKFKTENNLPPGTDITNYKIFIEKRTYSKTESFPIFPSKLYSLDTKISELIGQYNLYEPLYFIVQKLLVNQEVSDFEVIKKVLEKYASTGAKIILQSSGSSGERARTRLNVFQQFQFNHQPISPIILIDINFFKPNAQYDFYKYLKFEGPTISEKIKEKTTFTNSQAKLPKVQIFKKPANKELEILGTPVRIIQNGIESEITIEDQEYYKNEVLLQANVCNIDIKATELEICCIQAELDQNDVYLSNKSKSNFYKLINQYGTKFSVYDYSTGLDEMEKMIGKKENTGQRSTMENLD
jgi:hypothetical protein